MGYFVQGDKNWRITERKGKGKSVTIPREAYQTLGFRFDMTFEEARARCKQLNLQNRLEHKKALAAATRIQHQKLINKAYLPSLYVTSFEEHLKDITYGIKFDKTIFDQWSTVQRIISTLELDPKDFYENRHKFYRYFMSKKISNSYASKLIRIINLWGHFYSKTTNSFYQPVPRPDNNTKQKLADAREDKTGVRREAIPLTPSILNNVKATFINNGLEPHFNWLFISLWFGLRPGEVDGLKNAKNWYVKKDVKNNIDVLYVYQSKLTNIAKDKRWKIIPICFDEQKEAMTYINSANFKRPLVKSITKYIDDGYDNYSGRKGFTDLMLSKGFDLESISLFLGHRDISTTWKHYKDKFTFTLPKVG